jgi:hypothetical protein
MKISYELQDFDLETCEEISKQLRAELVPHILDNKLLLIDKTNEDVVDKILSKIGSVHSLLDHHDSTWTPPLSTQEIIDMLIEEDSSESSTSKTTSYDSNDEPGTIALVGLLIGGGFGVLIVIAAFSDPSFEGRVYIFLPAIILGLLGFAIGYGIEKVIQQVRKNW